MDLMAFTYDVVFEKTKQTYRLISYNSPWDNERELDDIRVMFDGKDLNGTDLPAYKAVKWESLNEGKYRAFINMKFIKNQDESYDQLFKLEKIESV